MNRDYSACIERLEADNETLRQQMLESDKTWQAKIIENNDWALTIQQNLGKATAHLDKTERRANHAERMQNLALRELAEAKQKVFV